MRRRSFLSRSLTISLAVASSAATLSSALWAANPTTSGVLRRSRGGTLTTLDPHRALSSVDLEVAADCFTALTRVDADGAIVPACASRWQVSSDGRRYEFFLRSGLRWSNGSVIDASDVVASIRRLLQPETGALLAYRYDAIKGAANYRIGKATASALGVSAPARDRVVIELEHPRENASVPAARRAPAAWRVEGKMFWVELGEGLAGLDVGARGGEPGKDFAAGREEETRTFP